MDAGLPKACGKDDVQLRNTLERLRTCVADDSFADYQTFLDFDYWLYSCCVRVAGNSQLLKIFEDTKLNLQLARANLMKPVGDALAAHREHAAIVIAFDERSPEALKAAFRRHEASCVAYLSGIFEQ